MFLDIPDSPRVDDVSDRLVGTGADRRKQLLSLANAASRADHRNPAVADDKSNIGDRAVVPAGHKRGQAMMREQARGNLADFKLLWLCVRDGYAPRMASVVRHQIRSAILLPPSHREAMSIIRCSIVN